MFSDIGSASRNAGMLFPVKSCMFSVACIKLKIAGSSSDTGSWENWQELSFCQVLSFAF